MKYRRVMLKLSGELLQGQRSSGIDAEMLRRVSGEIIDAVNLGVELSLVIGGGNFHRGHDLQKEGLDRVTSDHIGMLATVINALALRAVLAAEFAARLPRPPEVRVLSSLNIEGLIDRYQHQRALAYAEAGDLLIFCAGTGNPLFTTDTAACLRGIELGVDLVIKATKFDGVYSADPQLDPDASRYDRLTYQQVMHDDLRVMDMAAIDLCRDHCIPITVCSLFAGNEGTLLSVLKGEKQGTLITSPEGGLS